MLDVEKNVHTDVANRAHMIFKAKVNTPLKKDDMLVKASKALNL